MKTYQSVLQNGYQSKELLNWIRVVEFQLLPLNPSNEQNILRYKSGCDLLFKIDKNKLERLLKKSEILGDNNNPNANQNIAFLKAILGY